MLSDPRPKAQRKVIKDQVSSVTTSSPSTMTMSSSPASSAATGLNGTPTSQPSQVLRLDYAAKADNLSTPNGRGGHHPQEPPIVDRTPSHQLGEGILTALKQRNLDLPINEECTSLAVHPSGRFVLAGFCDGTLRIFPMESMKKSGRRLSNDRNSGSVDDDDEEEEHEADLDDLDMATTASSGNSSKGSDANESASSRSQKKSKGMTRLVSSSEFQKYGAVACQIHARGVHTDLLMHIECSQDGDYCFAGVQRGSMELYAVYLGDLVRYYNRPDQQSSGGDRKNILDYLRVYVHSDGKLKGFGACVRVLPQKKDHPIVNSRPKYMLLTGLGIKNIHIWSFEPPVYDKNGITELKSVNWTQLYDTQTNGNTISLLSFVYTPANSKLLAVSKSDRQKLRLWDLSGEQKQTENADELKSRPKRPNYKDVLNTEAGLAIAGSKFCICGGGGMYNQMSIVSLEQAQSVYNHTELELPVADTESPSIGTPAKDTPSTSRRRRPQRGDLKQVVSVASMSSDASHVMLELDDGALVHYTTQAKGKQRCDKNGRFPRLDRVPKSAGIPEQPAEYYSRTMCLANLHGEVVVAAVSLYNPNTGSGSIAVRAIEWISGISQKPMMSLARSSVSPQVTDRRAIRDCVQAPPGKKKRKSNTEHKVGKDSGVSSNAFPPDSTAKRKKLIDRRDSTGSDKSSARHGVKLFSGTNSAASLLVTPQLQRRETSGDKVANSKVKAQKKSKASNLSADTVKNSSPDGSRLPLAQTVSPEQHDAFATPSTSSLASKQSDTNQKTIAMSAGACKSEKGTKSFNKKYTVEDKNFSRLTPKLKSSKNASLQHDGSSVLVTKKKASSISPSPASSTQQHLMKQRQRSNDTSLGDIAVGLTTSSLTTPSVPRKKRRKSGGSEGSVHDETVEMTPLREPLSVSKRSSQGDAMSALVQPKRVVKSMSVQKGPKIEIRQDHEEKKAIFVRKQDQEHPKSLMSTPIQDKKRLKTVSMPLVIERDESSQVAKENKIQDGKNHQDRNKLSDDVPSQVRDSSQLLKALSSSQGLTRSKGAAVDVVNRVEVAKSSVDDNGVGKGSSGKSKNLKDGKSIVGEDLDALQDVASALCQLKSPSCTPAKNKRGSPTVCGTSTTPKRAKASTNTSKKTPKRKVVKSVPPDQDEAFLCQYQRLKALLESLPKSQLSFTKLFQPSDLKTLEERQEAARDKMAAEHYAYHEVIRKRLLQSAVSISRLFLDSSLSVEAAKSQLMDAMRSYHALLADTLNRQEFEASTLAAQQTFQRGGVPAEAVKVSFPFSSTFNAVDEMVEFFVSRRGSIRSTAL